MHSDSAETLSIWMKTTHSEEHPPLAGNLTTDVCVVGAGIAGLTTAYLLAREGRGVVVLDDGPVGGGETSRTTAHLASALDDRFYELESLHGAEGARLAAESHAYAIDLVEQIAARESIECDFRRVDGYLFLAAGGPPAELEREHEAARRAGLKVALHDRMPIDFHAFGPALRFADQARFHAMKYLHGLSAAARRHGVRIHTGTTVVGFDSGAPVCVRTGDGHTVRANALVVATNSPINDLVTMHTKQASYRTYVIALPVPRGAVPDVLMWDTGDPYHYVRICGPGTEALPDQDLLLVGGEDHKTGQAQDFEAPYQRLVDWARARFPMAGAPVLRWSGQVIEPIDGLAFIGHNPTGGDNVFIATGDSGNGLTHGTLAGRILCDLVQSRSNPWAQLYDPARRKLRAAGEFARENLNVAAQYADLLTGGEVESTAAIAAGTGAVVRRGLHKVAAYRDENGTLYERSAFCTHLGCVVAWNAAERSWDCPCHGSRFDKIDGHPLNGPALMALREVEDQDQGGLPQAARDARRGRDHRAN